MDINRANLQAMFNSYNTAFQDGLGVVTSLTLLAPLFRQFPSTTAANFYGWLERLPGFREWVGDRVFHAVRSNRFEVENRDFEDSVSVPNKDIEDDQYGVYTPLVGMMGEAWPELKAEIIIAVFTSNMTTFTGKPLFATNHKYGKNTIANKVATALSAAAFDTAFETAAEWKFSNGKLCKPRFTHLVHGPKLRGAAFAIVDSERVSAGDNKGGAVDNPNYKRVQRLELPELAGSYQDHWYLMDASRPIKPVALQVRKEAAVLMDTNPETVERSGKVDVMASGRAAAAPTFPHLVYGGGIA